MTVPGSMFHRPANGSSAYAATGVARRTASVMSAPAAVANAVRARRGGGIFESTTDSIGIILTPGKRAYGKKFTCVGGWMRWPPEPGARSRPTRGAQTLDPTGLNRQVIYAYNVDSSVDHRDAIGAA